ncbi:hypothetical protein NP493_516g02047 [Ridgeia piscesae]|uniref:EGF-like domain-containing protein n=1 Tax=Ridgeia piscesae TaxID=27915 RepID=A0AAD9KX96_RIDPI|nr:hypothetical protein NP493_516g02047 [Ridgeia piscesae]
MVRVPTEITCPPGLVYVESAPGCNATCADPDAPENCPIQGVQACVCGPNLVMQDGVCVPSILCGCTDPHGNHHNIDETWAVGCSTYTCEMCSTCTRGVPHLVETVTDCQPGYECVVDGSTVTCVKIHQPCDDAPCQNGGSCTNKDNGYECACLEGFTGVNCELVVHPCDNSPCLNGGLCNKVGAGYVCSCEEGFTGTDCESDYFMCDANPCQNGGTCTNVGKTGYLCTCAPGFTGTDCESIVYPCDSSPCLHGTCTNVGTNFVCDCEGGYTGDTCESVIMPCDSGPCQHGATCTNVGTTGYTCTCPTGYTGVLCESEFTACDSHPCVNGVCKVVGTGYECSCSNGYTGVNCESEIDHCSPQPCQHGGSCVNVGAGYECHCADGFTGDTCETALTACSSFPCKNGGSCRVTSNAAGYECDCPDGYEGTNCDQAECKLDKCVSNFDAAKACQECTLTSNIVGYIADPCHCDKYYQCQWLPDGWHAIRRPCPGCLYWNQKTLTCSIRISMSCVIVTNITGKGVISVLCCSPLDIAIIRVAVTVSSCPLKAVASDITQYRHNGNLRVCPARTLFSDYACACIIGPNPGPVSSRTPITCISFDKGWDGFQTTNWVYMQFTRILRVRGGKRGYAAFFNGGAHIEIPRFTFSYSRLKKLSISFWYKCTGKCEQLQGLVTNGDCVSDASLRIATKGGTIQASQTNIVGGRSTTVSIVDVKADEQVWHHVAYVWNGSQVILYVDNIAYDLGTAKGRIMNKRCALVIGHTNRGKFFRGYLDELCIYETALTPGDVSALYNI